MTFTFPCTVLQRFCSEDKIAHILHMKSKGFNIKEKVKGGYGLL